MAGLLGAQQVSCPAHFQIFQRNPGSTPQFGGGGQGCEAIMSKLSHRHLRVIQKVGVTALPAPSHSTAQLVKLGQSVALCAVDNEGVGVGDIQTCLDNCGGDQNIKTSLPEIHHDRFEIGFGHLAVRHRHASFGDKFLNVGGHPVDRRHPVVNEKHLTFA